MTGRSAEPLFTAAQVEPPKQRTCLRCSTMFASEWIGERICRRCKSSHAWRAGLPASFSTSRR